MLLCPGPSACVPPRTRRSTGALFFCGRSSGGLISAGMGAATEGCGFGRGSEGSVVSWIGRVGGVIEADELREAWDVDGRKGGNGDDDHPAKSGRGEATFCEAVAAVRDGFEEIATESCGDGKANGWQGEMAPAGLPAGGEARKEDGGDGAQDGERGEGIVQPSFEIARGARGAIVVMKHAGAADGECCEEDRDEHHPVVAGEGEKTADREEGEQDGENQEACAHDFWMGLALGGGVAKRAGDMRIAWSDHPGPDDKRREDKGGDQSCAEQHGG